MNNEITAAVKTAEKTLEKMTGGSIVHPIQTHQLHLTEQGGVLNVSQKKKKKNQMQFNSLLDWSNVTLQHWRKLI